MDKKKRKPADLKQTLGGGLVPILSTTDFLP
jgi:hypothetical protein